MIINPQISQVFKEYNIPLGDGMLCLFTIYYDLNLSEGLEKALDTTMKQINISKIVERDYTNHDVKWNIPLFSGQETAWEWVLTEYRPIFLKIRKDRGGTPTSCVKRMKDFFKTHPDVRKHEVIAAALAYVASVDNPDFLQGADYFIKKDVGTNATSRLEQYIEMVRVKNQANDMRDVKMMGT